MSSDSENSLPLLHTLWDYRRPAESEARFRALLPRAEAVDPEYALIVWTQIARTHSLRDQFAEAHALLDRVETAPAVEEMPLVRLRYLLERGRCFHSAGEKERARPLFRQAYDLGRQIGPAADYHTIDAAHMLGIAAADTAQMLAWNEKGIDLAEASADLRANGWLGALYNNNAWTYADAGDLEEALQLFQRAWLWRQEQSGDQPHTIRIAKWCVAHLWRRLGMVSGALALLRELEAEWAAAGEESGYVVEDMAECYAVLGRHDEARSYYARAYTLLAQESWLVRHEAARLARLRELGGLRE